MKQNKGISQIVVMVIMLILAIALPITTKLVQKSQENRSKATAAGTKVYGQRCESNSECKSGYCTVKYSPNHNFTGADGTKVCSKDNSDEACLTMGGACTSPMSAASWSSCGTSKYVIYNLCLSPENNDIRRCCVPMPKVGEQCGNSGTFGKCVNVGTNNTDGVDCSVDGGTNNGKVALGLCGADSNIRCCVPKPIIKVCTTGDKQCSGTKLQTCTNNAWVDTTDCGALGCNATTKACNAAVCTAGATQCLNGTTKQTCTNNAWGGNETCAYGCSSGACNNPTCAVDEKRCSSNILEKCNSTRTGWVVEETCDLAYGCNSTTKSCNECINGNQKCSTSDNYFTCNSGSWSTSTTDCIGNEICTNTNISSDVCVEPEYVAPKLTMHVSMLGIGGKNIQAQCLGTTLTLRVNVAKFNAADSDNGITRQVTATKVNDKFSTVKTAGDGYQVYEIKDFVLDTTYLPSDKIFVNVTSPNNGTLKLLATLYGKNDQTGGYAAQNGSQLLISSLSNPLNFYNYPILNGDIGSDNNNTLGDGVLNGSDFGHIKNQWGKSVASGQAPLRADLNGDCVVDSLDFQIYKKSSEEQYASKEF
jgi:hypothetical protein